MKKGLKANTPSHLTNGVSLSLDGNRLIISVPVRVIPKLTVLQTDQTSVLLPALSPREDEVLKGLLAHLSNKEIGTSAHIAERTVKYYVTQLMDKFGVRSRYKLARLFQ